MAGLELMIFCFQASQFGSILADKSGCNSLVRGEKLNVKVVPFIVEELKNQADEKIPLPATFILSQRKEAEKIDK